MKSLVEKGRYYPIDVAENDAVALGFSKTEIGDVLLDLEYSDFYKTMTQYNNSKVWQDVYKIRAREYKLYIKFKIVNIGEEDVVVMSFKKDTGEKR